jgi:signal transduction histidine kinase
MSGPSLRKSGSTLGFGEPEGHAHLRRIIRGYTLRRAAMTGVAVGAFIAGLAASSAALQGEADPGVVADVGGEVLSVSPTGFAWREGIRAGQRVVAVSAVDDPGGWRLETVDDGRSYVAEASRADAGLTASLPLGIGALFAGAAAVLLLGIRRQWVVPTSATAFLIASTPLALHGNVLLSTYALAGAALIPGGWAAARLPGPRIKTAALGLSLAAFLAYWTASRVGGWPLYDQFESLRAGLAIWGTGAVIVDRTIIPRLSGEPVHVIRPRPFEIGAIALIAGLALALTNLFAASPIAVGFLCVAATLLLPTVRRRLRPLEDALLADVRHQAAADAAEAERARLARELHDVPLQELIGIVRRLEVLPGTKAESDDLRALASHLRNVAMDLRPPVLEDLGLPAALEYLVEETTSNGRVVIAQIDDRAGVDRARRPPTEVELAMYRIATEAVGNSVRHSGASEIRVQAEVERSRVELVVTDNGSGLDGAAIRGARRGKHMGLSLMRRRAQTIDADLSINGNGSGTIVRALWQA